jgi:BirA family transcriptional regulator, biotin operon repressor / biotin---[acetyl-CoA-carboxylase] ligase
MDTGEPSEKPSETPSEKPSEKPSDKQSRLVGLSSPATMSVLPEIRWIAECGSTNTVLADEARDVSAGSAGSAGSELPGTVLIADRQTAGKGRLGRTWEAPIGSALTMSLRVPISRGAADSHLGLLPLAVGLANYATLVDMQVDPDRVELKWPNDVMDPQTGRKLAGILCEAIPVWRGEDAVTYVVIGIGVNLNRPDHVEGIVAERAQWVSEILSQTVCVDVVDFACRLIPAILAKTSLLESNPARLISEVQHHCATIGQHVRVEQLNANWTGVATSIDHSGALIVLRDDSTDETRALTAVHAADVVHLRPGNIS